MKPEAPIIGSWLDKKLCHQMNRGMFPTMIHSYETGINSSQRLAFHSHITYIGLIQSTSNDSEAVTFNGLALHYYNYPCAQSSCTSIAFVT
jgi:hypothetical protein